MAKTDISVRELADKVKRGELALPEMQRRYVWPATRVRDLLDSLYRGYPSGTILVWETDEAIETRELAVQATEAPTTTRKLLLLDGQQRITSLTSILEGQPVYVRNRKRPIEILFNMEHPEGPPVDITEVEDDKYTIDIEDIDEEEAERDLQEELKKRTFVVSSRSLQGDPVWVSVSDIFKIDHTKLIQNAGINSLDDPKFKLYSERLAQVKAIQDYPYVMQILERSMTYEEVTEIFVRVNSLGMKLRSSDLAMAQVSAKWKGFVKELESFAQEFKDNADYIVETGLPVRLMVAFATGQSKFKSVGRIPLNVIKESWDKAKQGLTFAVNFIKSNGEIEVLNHLSSPFLLIPLAVYAVLNDEKIDDESHKKLLKWFYYAHMRGHYGMGSSESILDVDLRTVLKDQSLDKLIERLHLHVKKFNIDQEDLVRKGTRSPIFSMLYFIMKQGPARDWFTGLDLSDVQIGNSHNIQYHHIVPKSLIKDMYDKEEVNEIANMAFIGGKTNRRITNKEPKEYFEQIIRERGEEALTDQLIPMNKELWDIKNYDKFLAERRRLIIEAINGYMKQYE